jgi:Zn-dependent protease
MYLMSGFVFGYAKPLPINYGQMRHPKRDMAWVALSGPGANFLMALMWVLLGIFLDYFSVQESFPHLVADAGLKTNLWLMAFNLLPIPSMDGGRVLFSILPHKAAFQFARLEPYSFIILLALIFLPRIGFPPVIGYWLFFVELIAKLLLHLIVSPLNILLT